MKIVLVTEFFPDSKLAMSGGVEARTYHLAHHLQKQGHQVKVIARQKRHVAATPTSIFPRLWFQLEAVVRGMFYHPDIVEGSNFVCYVPAYILARLRGARAIAWYADVYGKTWFETMKWPVAVAGYLWEWFSLHLPWDTVIAMSKSTKDKLIKAGVKPKRMLVVYGGVDQEIIDNIFVNIYDKPTICTAARLVPYKHIDDLIRATAEVKKTIPEIQLNIMGEGPERIRLEQLSNKLSVQKHVHWLGNLPQEEVWRVMKRSQVFCLPSLVEGFGLVTIEAMACGLPYVAADIPATREVTRGGVGGYLYEPRNIEQLTACLLKALKFKHLVTKEVRDLVKSYRWDTITQQTLECYDE